MPQYIQLSLFDQIPTKRCNVCQRELPATAEFWHVRRASADGLSLTCKTCAIERTKKWYRDDPERARAAKREYHQTHKKERRLYRSENADKIRAYKQSPKQKVKDAEYRRRKNSERLAYNRKYKQDHPGHYAKLTREWRRNNPEKAKANIHRRIARKHAALGDYTAADVKRMYAQQDGMCIYCGIRIFMDIPKNVHVDHVLPLARGGANNPDNLALSCSSCNHSKNAKTIREWQATRGW